VKTDDRRAELLLGDTEIASVSAQQVAQNPMTAGYRAV
jgi:hypothetical protein